MDAARFTPANGRHSTPLGSKAPPHYTQHSLVSGRSSGRVNTLQPEQKQHTKQATESASRGDDDDNPPPQTPPLLLLHLLKCPYRVVRRKSLREKVSAWFNFLDFLIYISEEIETRDWDSAAVGTRVGLALNLLFFLARAQSSVDDHTDDDLFSDSPRSGWFSYLVSTVVWSLTAVSVLNAAYTFTRSRNYRLFEVNIENGPDTPNARRARVQSSPSSGSPLRWITNVMATETPESRAYPDKTRDVWELAVWDPLPLCLRTFCLFSPGHFLIYRMFLPLVTLDPCPSVTVFKCVVLQVLLSAQMFALQYQYAQKIKDNGIIQKEVLHEYDAKFVHPRNQRTVRDVGTQLAKTRDGRRVEYISTGTPTTQIQRKFETHPNQNYAKHFNPDNYGAQSVPAASKSRIFSPSPIPPPPKPHTQQTETLAEEMVNPFATRSRIRQSPVVRRSMPAGVTAPVASPPVGMSSATSTMQTHGGSLGVYQHVKSPLKKATSLSELNDNIPHSPRNSREMAALEQQQRKERPRARHSSPSKSNLFPSLGRPSDKPGERYPSRW
ncbi:hypothetical protein MKZ38_004996 [Zalerion maritima]|uniref:Meiotically up-regulated gene 154 protein n=1 Tax=Zalerion maritima TaxID=339359 RepID=A0AAD5WR96_9PEZI|nr:hypothetical protein MKZ38_004996 [Zalerion maritima]